MDVRFMRRRRVASGGVVVTIVAVLWVLILGGSALASTAGQNSDLAHSLELVSDTATTIPCIYDGCAEVLRKPQRGDVPRSDWPTRSSSLLTEETHAAVLSIGNATPLRNVATRPGGRFLAPVTAIPCSASRAVAPKAASSGAENAANLGRLNKQLASEAQMAAPGKPIIGAGTKTPLRAAEDLASRYGGDAGDWAKMSSGNYNSGGGGIYDLFETHWYENIKTGQQVEFKTKFPWAEAEFNKP